MTMTTRLTAISALALLAAACGGHPISPADAGPNDNDNDAGSSCTAILSGGYSTTLSHCSISAVAGGGTNTITLSGADDGTDVDGGAITRNFSANVDLSNAMTATTYGYASPATVINVSFSVGEGGVYEGWNAVYDGTPADSIGAFSLTLSSTGTSSVVDGLNLYSGLHGTATGSLIDSSGSNGTLSFSATF
jgi:hypothetical protein